MEQPTCNCHDPGEPMYWHRLPKMKAGGRWECAVAHRDSARSWATANPERHRERARSYKQANPWMGHHHLSNDSYFDLLAQQDGKCAGCGITLEAYRKHRGTDALMFDVDHDHACCPGEFSCGRCVRGLLCRSCNRKDALARH